MSPVDVAQLALHVGFPHTQLAKVVCVAKVESDWNAAAIHDGNFGLMQINRANLKTCGLSSAKQLLNPKTNMTCSFILWQTQKWKPWCKYWDCSVCRKYRVILKGKS